MARRDRIQVITSVSSGDSIQILNSDNSNNVFVSPSVELAAFTLIAPTEPHDNQRMSILFSKKIDVFTLSGGSIPLPSMEVLAGSVLDIMWDAQNTCWMIVGSNPSKHGITIYIDGVKYENCVPIFEEITVASGIATAYLTDDRTPNGTALYSEIYEKTLSVWIKNKTASNPSSFRSISGNKKKVEIDVNQQIISLGILSISAGANGIKANLQGWGRRA